MTNSGGVTHGCKRTAGVGEAGKENGAGCPEINRPLSSRPGKKLFGCNRGLAIVFGYPDPPQGSRTHPRLFPKSLHLQRPLPRQPNRRTLRIETHARQKKQPLPHRRAPQHQLQRRRAALRPGRHLLPQRSTLPPAAPHAETRSPPVLPRRPIHPTRRPHLRPLHGRRHHRHSRHPHGQELHRLRKR